LFVIFVLILFIGYLTQSVYWLFNTKRLLVT